MNSIKELERRESHLRNHEDEGCAMEMGQSGLEEKKTTVAELLSPRLPKVRGGMTIKRLCGGKLSTLSKKMWAG